MTALAKRALPWLYLTGWASHFEKSAFEQMTFEDIYFLRFFLSFSVAFLDVRQLEGSQLGRGVFTGASFENMSL